MKYLVLISALLLAACGGGGGGGPDTGNDDPPPPAPPPDAKPGGYYTGSFVSDSGGSAIRVDGMVLESGEAVFMSQYGAYTAHFEPDGTTLDAEFEAFALLGWTWDGTNSYLHGNIDGTVSERAGINGSYTLGGDSGTFSLTYKPEGYEGSSAMSYLVGAWGYSVPDTGYTVSVNIDSNGIINGSDTDSCTYYGQVSLVDPNYNGYKLTNMRIDCPGFSLTGGTGLAYTAITPDSRTGLQYGVQFNEKFAYIDFWLDL